MSKPTLMRLLQILIKL